MLEVEVFGARRVRGVPTGEEMRSLCTQAAARLGVDDGHVAIEFVDAGRIAELNAEHRQHAGATDVLSFPMDGIEPVEAPRELGDIIICPERTEDLREAIVHGMLHLLGMDHERDDGEMLALQRELLAGADV